MSRDLLDNTQRNYKRLGSIVNDARLAGLIDWDHISDRTRNLRSNSHWDAPEDVIESAASAYAIDKWATQPRRVEVYVEKDALIGVFEGVCTELDVPYFSCRGYTSQSEMWAAGRRQLQHRLNKQKPLVLHFGDMDPSGLDMSRDITERLRTFAEAAIEVKRVALNMDQVEEYEPPPNPAKQTDSRFESYEAVHGNESWELDALDPAVLVALIRREVLTVRDEALWRAAVAQERQERRQLTAAAEHWDDVVSNLREQLDDETL